MAVPNQAHILIVEDDPAIADMLVDLVRTSGFEASSVESGAAMDRMMARQQFDLIVLDAMLPGEDGFSICRRLRASCSVPILMLTALQEDIELRGCHGNLRSIGVVELTAFWIDAPSREHHRSKCFLLMMSI